MTIKNMTTVLASALLALLCTLPAIAANLAGSTIFVSGKVTATNPAGEVRELKGKDKIYSGDLLETRKGRIQIKFLDGAFMSVQPNSRFQIEDYNYANQSDGSEKAVYNLFKGGMRAFTGAIGKKHPDAYKVKTPVATIGIRGTGHNTRICQGDCYSLGGVLLPDGLRHSTWEGITIVTNDFGTSVVPFGNSVYVQDIGSPAEQTNEASEVTAVQESLDTVEEQVVENQEQVVLEAGDQVDSGGDPEFIPPPDPAIPELEMVPGRTLLGITPEVHPDFGDDENSGEGQFFDTTVLNAVDNRAGMPGMVASIGTEDDDDEIFEVLLTIDPNGVLDVSAPDSAVALAQDFITTALADGGANAAAVNAVIDDPAALVEYREGTFGGSDYALGRWSDGNILFIDEVTVGVNVGDREVEFDTLAADQSLHFLHSDPAAAVTLGGSVTGTYDLVDATASSRTTGGPNGVVQPGSTLTFDFTSLNGTIDMDVLHDAELYMVNGALLIDFDSPGEFFDTNVTATTTAGGSCDPACPTIVDGTFFGPLDGAGVDGAPILAGIDYDIVLVPFDTVTPAVGDSIIGNAIFGRSGTAAPIPDVFTVTPNQNLVVVLPNPTQPLPQPEEFADVGLILDTTSIVGDDSTNTTGLLLAAGTEINDDFMPNEILFLVATIDPDGMLGVTDPDPNLVAAQGLITDALVSDNALVQSVNNNPAKLAEFFQGTGFAYGRWANGNILFLDENIGGGGTLGDKTVEVDTLADNQSLHFIYGDTPATPATGATGTYDFIGGTQSTTYSGTTIGLGATSGRLTFDFDTPLNATIVMKVNHDSIDYNVAGMLELDTVYPGQFFDQGVTATTSGGNCDAGCNTFIDGGFAGALSGGAQASPEFAGLEYDIFDPVDGIMGVAAFSRTGDGPAPIP